MAGEKKFLDASGVAYLWSQLSLQDYPNNEVLAAVINAIDGTKADKEHTHNIDDITNLQTELDANKAAIADKASHTDLEAAVVRIEANETAIAAFIDISKKEISALFATQSV